MDNKKWSVDVMALNGMVRALSIPLLLFLLAHILPCGVFVFFLRYHALTRGQVVNGWKVPTIISGGNRMDGIVALHGMAYLFCTLSAMGRI